jgi:hypothetical protein
MASVVHGVAIGHLEGYLLMEGLLVWLVALSECGRLDVGNRHGLLRTRLMHRKRTWPVVRNNRSLRQGMRLRRRQIADGRLNGGDDVLHRAEDIDRLWRKVVLPARRRQSNDGSGNLHWQRRP